MKTEDLNEYIFADLLHRHVQSFWRKRVRQFESEGIDNAIETTKLSAEDLRNAIELLDWYRCEGLKLLEEDRTKPFQDL